MYSLIFFLFNLVCVLGNYTNPTSSSTFYVNNSYEIQWDFPDVNQNLTHIFLTHGDPFKLSKFSNNQMVLADVVSPNESSYNWTLPFDLNYYSIEDINWRILLSNSSTPYSSNIGSHTVESIIYLSDFFTIQSNMNATHVGENLIHLDKLNYFTTNGFLLNSSDTPIEFRFIFKNTTNSFEIANFSSLPFNNQYLTVNLDDNDLNYTQGDYPESYEYTLANLENTNFFYTPYLQISVSQNSIYKNVTNIPIFFLRIIENNIDSQNSIIQTNCINYPSVCLYNLHINHNGVENIIYNQTNESYNLIKYFGDYEIWATVGSQSSNTITLQVTTTTMTTTPTTTPSTTPTTTQTTTPTTTSSILSTTPLLTTISDSDIYSTTLPINNTCNDNDSCENSDNDFPWTSLIAGILATLFFIFACYYICKLSKLSHKQRVHPRRDLESGNNNRNNAFQNSNYESTQETSFITSTKRPIEQARINTDFRPSHYYPDINRLDFHDQIIYASDNQYDEPNNNIGRRSGAFPNAVYTQAEATIFDQEYSTYYDNYGNRRPIRRRMSSSSYGYDYGPTHSTMENQHVDNINYNHLESQPTLRIPPSSEYNRLNRELNKEK